MPEEAPDFSPFEDLEDDAPDFISFEELEQEGLEPSVTVEEQHPDISTMDRATISLFQRGDDDVRGSLEKKGFTVSQDAEGRFEIFKPGDDVKRRLDPDTGFFSSDIVGDAADLSREAVEFGAQTLAAIPKVGGVLAAPVSGGSSLLAGAAAGGAITGGCLLYTSPSPRDATLSRMPSSA